MRFQATGFHVGDPKDFALTIDEGDAEGNERMFHPKTVKSLGFEYEQHAFIFTEVCPVHQSPGAFRSGLRHLHPGPLILDVDGNFWKPLGAHHRRQGESGQGDDPISPYKATAFRSHPIFSDPSAQQAAGFRPSSLPYSIV